MNTKNLMDSSFTPLVYNLSRNTPLVFWENKSLKSELPSDGTNKIKSLLLYRRSSYLYFLTLPPTQHLIPYNSTPAQINKIICVRFPCPAVSVNCQKSVNQQTVTLCTRHWEQGEKKRCIQGLLPEIYTLSEQSEMTNHF